MIRIIYTLTMLTLFFVGCTKDIPEVESKSSIKIVDDLGITYQSDIVPKKIISLAPNLTEMIYELGLDSILIGNTKYCNYPKEAIQKEKIGDLLTVDYEKIIELKPDLIFITVEGNAKESYDKLNKLGFQLFVSNPRNFDGIKKTFHDISKIFRIEKIAENKIKLWDEVIENVKSEALHQKKRSGMFLVSLKPVMLAGGNTFVNEFLKIVGINNIASDSKVSYPLFSREEILTRNPEIIIHAISNDGIDSEISNNYPEWKKIAAVKNQNIIKVDPDLFFRPGPRYPIAVQKLWDKIKHI
ncbi:MAG: helical backbone metal receptor [Melioribacteraceae bacterium]|nr:helical backbone metal receptor [Melioribacteraceae bacterium]